MLIAERLGKSYDAGPVLRDISLTLSPGRITCLVGPSGSGKTTLLKCLSMVEPASSGTISLDGRTYSFPLQAGQAEPEPRPWPALTAVFQSLFLWPHLTLRENILLPGRQANPEAERDLSGLAALFEMEEFLDRYPNEVSGGQKQRAALARALLLNPRYILLDEITSALDVEQSARILTKLTHLRERGIGVLLITHHLQFARRVADHILFLAGGAVVEEGSPSILDAPATPRLRDFVALAGLAA